MLSIKEKVKLYDSLFSFLFILSNLDLIFFKEKS